MPKSKPALSEAERAERRRADREFAKRAVEQLQSSEGWRSWLAARARFRSYSLMNQLLIAMQCPDATRVAGFRTWLKLGYCVSKGEKAIRIWVPIGPARKEIKEWESAGADPAERPRPRFRLGPVFDRGQVQALPAPAVQACLEPPIRDITGCELMPLMPELIKLGFEIGSLIEFEELSGDRRGYYEIDSRRIAIRRDMEVNAQVKTLVHELAHALLRAEPGEDDPELSRAAEELVVESVAYTVCGSFGLDSSGYSVPYMAAWAEEGQLETLEQMAGLIDRLASRIDNAAAGGSEEEAL
jgi:antirestriction protein ArdC